MTSGIPNKGELSEPVHARQPSALCGKCLHHRDAHTKHNGHFMVCACCLKLCDIDEFLQIHKPTESAKVMEIGARKQ